MQIEIKKTKKTPYFSIQNNTIELKGSSIPENAMEFYSILTEHINNLVETVNEKIIFNIKLEYLNSASIKALIQLMKIFEKRVKEGKEATINWYYEQGDDDMKDSGEDLKDLLDLPFYILTY